MACERSRGLLTMWLNMHRWKLGDQHAVVTPGMLCSHEVDMLVAGIVLAEAQESQKEFIDAAKARREAQGDGS